MPDSKFRLEINDFETFVTFVQIIRNEDSDKIRELVKGLNKDSDDLIKAEQAEEGK